MSEARQRCRYYPGCGIHRGLRSTRYFSAANAAEMTELREVDAWTWHEIARAYGTSHGRVVALVRRHKIKGGGERWRPSTPCPSGT